MASKGLYSTAFSDPGGMMDEYRTNRHWKREEDNYLQQMGILPKIMEDPHARLGYQAQQDPEMLTLRMDPFPEGQNLGNYSFYPDPQAEGLKAGKLSLKPDQGTVDWGESLLHELGHAGSRNMRTEDQAYDYFVSGAEEERQRFVDYILNPPTSVLHQDAKRLLRAKYGEDLDKEAAAFREMIFGSDEEVAAPIPKPKPQKKAGAKKKKKYLLDFLK